MAENSAIEWCDATFNPWIGCTRISPACDNCYAAAQDNFRGWTPQGWGGPRRRTSVANWRQPLQWNRNAGVFYAENQRRMRVFCASLADVFDNQVPAEWRADLFTLIDVTPNLDWLLLTKRIGNVPAMLTEILRPGTMPPNVWLGATVANQEEADRDIPKLLATPARVRFLSMEPLLGPVNLLPAFMPPEIDWVIVGGESGHGARPMHPDWARSLRDQCAAAGVPFLFKQWGEHVPAELALVEGQPEPWRIAQNGRRAWDATESLRARDTWEAVTFWKPGKKVAGRLLDGVTHDGFPEVT